MRRVALPALIALLALGCYVSVNEDNADYRGGGDRWTQQATMRAGERALFDGGELEITLREVRQSWASLQIKDDRGQNLVELRSTGPGSGVHWPPYHIWLASTGASTATITVSKVD